MTIEKIKELSKKYFDEVVSIRRHIHQNPELSFQEFQTSKYIYDSLVQMGLQPKTIANTGVTALIEGENEGRTIALRADMDALPIQEKNSHGFSSQHNGVMHACGHDVHTSSLLGVAKVLNDLKSEIKGKKVFSIVLWCQIYLDNMSIPI